MNKIPLQIRLKREIHRKIASAQDLVVKEIYAVFDKAVFHGGTAIWRCYEGNRFSEDLDFYLPQDREKLIQLFNRLEKIGFKIKKRKISENSVYSELEIDRTSVRLEATFQKKSAIICDYEMSDGNFISVYSLTAEDFLIEKINTYLKRFKVRDLWDVFFLLKIIPNPQNIKEIKTFIKDYKKPVDEEDLKTILLEGIVPSSKEMLEYIRRKRENKYM